MHFLGGCCVKMKEFHKHRHIILNASRCLAHGWALVRIVSGLKLAVFRLGPRARLENSEAI